MEIEKGEGRGRRSGKRGVRSENERGRGKVRQMVERDMKEKRRREGL
jgi:hypothetical protein